MDVIGQSAAEIAAQIAERIPGGQGSGRRLLALAGPPASGKSAVAAALVRHLAGQGLAAGYLPMDHRLASFCLLNLKIHRTYVR